MKYLITVSSIIELIYFDPRGIEIGHWFFFPCGLQSLRKWLLIARCNTLFHLEDLLLVNLLSSKLYLQYVTCSIEVKQQSINQCYTEQCIK